MTVEKCDAVDTLRVSAPLARTLSVAPMMDCTDRWLRYLLRLITRHTLVYTEMITTGALLHGDAERFLAHDPREHPVAIQLGGSDPAQLAACAQMAADHGYDEINLNVGCPSDRVQTGRIGACLMADPDLVAECVGAMKARVEVPVTVKSRIGIDHQDDYPSLCRFVATLAEAGCDSFIIHARKAWLTGLSPKENREVPPLRYDRVYRLKADFPELEICLNGGVRTLEEARAHLGFVDGVMIGREAYHNPWLLNGADTGFFGASRPPTTSRTEVVAGYLTFVERELEQGVRLQSMARHLLGLFQGQPGARAWRRHLSEKAHRTGAGAEVIREALAYVR